MSEDYTREKFLYELSITKYTLVHEVYQRLDDKTAAMLRICFTIIPIIIGVGNYILLDQSSVIPFLLLTGSTLSLVIAAVIGVVSYEPKEIRFLNPSIFYDRHYKDETDDLIETAATTISSTIELIESHCKDKSKSLKRMQIFVLWGTILMVGSFYFIFLL